MENSSTAEAAPFEEWDRQTRRSHLLGRAAGLFRLITITGEMDSDTLAMIREWLDAQATHDRLCQAQFEAEMDAANREHRAWLEQQAQRS